MHVAPQISQWLNLVGAVALGVLVVQLHFDLRLVLLLQLPALLSYAQQWFLSFLLSFHLKVFVIFMIKGSYDICTQISN